MDVRLPVWKPAPSNGDPSRVRIQESNANLVDRMQFAYLQLNTASHVILSVLSDCHTLLPYPELTSYRDSFIFRSKKNPEPQKIDDPRQRKLMTLDNLQSQLEQQIKPVPTS